MPELLVIIDTLKLGGLLAIIDIDIQKAFDSVHFSFLIYTLERYWFGKRFVKWMKFLLKLNNLVYSN